MGARLALLMTALFGCGGRTETGADAPPPPPPPPPAIEIGDEFAIDSTDYSQSRPAVACNDADCLVVWIENRGGIEVHGARVSAAGAVLEPGSFKIADAWVVRRLAVASNGDGFLVVWTGPPEGRVTDQVLAARVGGRGDVLDPGGLLLTSAGSETVVAAADGGDYFAAWIDPRDIMQGTAISADGVVVPPGGVDLSGHDWSAAPAIAYEGTEFLVIWADCYWACGMSAGEGPELSGRRVTSSGGPIGADELHIRLDEGSGGLVASVNGEYLIHWDRLSLFHAHDLFARVSADGTVLARFETSLTGRRLVSDGTGYLLVGVPCDAPGCLELLATRLTDDATVLDDPAFTITGEAGELDVAYNRAAERYLVVYTAQRSDGVWRVRARLLDAPTE